MIRKSLEITNLKDPSIYILQGSEIETLLSKCDSSYVDTARNDLKNGGNLIQVYHPNFLTSSEISNKHFLTSCISVILFSHLASPFYYFDYWILSYPLIPEDPVVYIVLKNRVRLSNVTSSQKDT